MLNRFYLLIIFLIILPKLARKKLSVQHWLIYQKQKRILQYKYFKMIKKISLVLLIVFYAAAGINHFIHEELYYPLIPPYFPNPALINIAAGVLEIIAAALLIFSTTRKYGVYLIIAMLIGFIPTHVYMIQMHGCMSEQICIPAFGAWLRLFPLQFILMWWAWNHRK
jgi:uncharacterized membrane protein